MIVIKIVVRTLKKRKKMESVIIRPKNEILNKHIQYFLFFKKKDQSLLHYTTFPNNNLCLAIYRQNNINYITDTTKNSCQITSGNKNFTTRLYGFHKMPFTVNIESNLEQICIIFKPSALRAFTRVPYEDLMSSDDFCNILSYKDDTVLEQIFEENEFSRKADKLEHLLLTNLKYEVPSKFKEALYLISCDNNCNLTVDSLAKNLDISTSSLFRLFKNNLGQNPKSYLKTIRFRSSLNEILNSQKTLTNVAYINQYFDQSHFINDFKSFSGYSPNQLIDKVSLQQNQLVWIYNKVDFD